MRDFLDICDLAVDEVRSIIKTARAMKAARTGRLQGATDTRLALNGHLAALIFEKPSTRTRVSFETGIRQLGGQTLFLSGREMQMGRGESAADTARVLSRYVDFVVLRTFECAQMQEFRDHSDVPVINALTDRSHPCQVMADIMTFEEHRGDIAGRRVAWLGAGNNVCASYIHAAAAFGFDLVIASPEGFEPEAESLGLAQSQGAQVSLTRDPWQAARDAALIVTDAWSSMHDPEISRTERAQALAPYRVGEEIMRTAHPDAVFMHCLPAYRGDEVSASVIDGAQSLVFDEAENRVHAQKAIMRWCTET